MSSSTPDGNAQPAQYHPEFGYLAPAMSLRRRAALVGKGVLFGAIVGVVAVAVWVSTQDAPVSVFSMQSQAAPGDALQGAPVPFVASTLAVPAAVQPAAPMIARAPVTATLVAAEPTMETPAAPMQQKAKRKQKKVARQPPRNRIVRSVEDDPRRAYAGPMPRFAEPSRGWSDRRPSPFGW